jgi:hypothetical protein
MEPVVDIAFDCLPLRSVGRMDAPLDASPVFRARYENLIAALEKYGPDRTYFLYDARCVFRLANSEVENMLRFEFEGIVRTDASDLLTESADLTVKLASETCGGVPDVVLTWFKGRVEKAVAIEFDRFIAAGQLKDRTAHLGQVERLSDVAGFSGMNL